ncbi:hypothetical protein BWI75_01700 [Gloeocapsopsis sp. AAB1 = 1H9]|uniref:Uncharacterized protein n=1 Tax=Gloeocapsopsis dulcis AAB1 = 1H9 TaxID=1433147 RepID=A0A6N8FT36_9CHRO|nr:hypothetical protein [Gloeocapsopsis dulcis AAB1 = 1H9]
MSYENSFNSKLKIQNSKLKINASGTLRFPKLNTLLIQNSKLKIQNYSLLSARLSKDGKSKLSYD